MTAFKPLQSLAALIGFRFRSRLHRPGMSRVELQLTFGFALLAGISAAALPSQPRSSGPGRVPRALQGPSKPTPRCRRAAARLPPSGWRRT